MPASRVLFFSHDQAYLPDIIHELNVRSKSCSKIQTLLKAASTVIQEQTVALNGPERACIGPFEDVVELAEQHFGRGRVDVIVEVVLCITAQIGQLIV